MIEINLRPGAGKRTRRRGRAGSSVLGKLRGIKLPAVDGFLAFAVAMWLVVPAATLWLHLRQGSTLEDLEQRLDAVLADSANLAAVHAQVAALDSVRRMAAERVGIIEEVDGGRYIWAHILDEVGRAVPDYLWLDDLRDALASPDPMRPTISIAGKAANPFAVTEFIRNLEASPFIGGVRFGNIDQVVENEKTVFSFVVEADYVTPPPDVLTVEPVLDLGEGD